jgi:hypothetical protein
MRRTIDRRQRAFMRPSRRRGNRGTTIEGRWSPVRRAHRDSSVQLIDTFDI